MLIHETLQEELVQERRARLAELESTPAPVTPRARPGMPGFVSALVPAFTHGLFGLPAPQRAARGGC